MKICVLGVGVIGTTYSYAFQKAGHVTSHIVRHEKIANMPKELNVNLLDGRYNTKGEEKKDIYSIEDYIEVRKETTSSVSVTVFSETNDIVSVIYGDANTKENIKANENTVYERCSISKMIVWTSVMQLWEHGKIDLNEDVRTYLPDGFLSNLSYKGPITMLHLMNLPQDFKKLCGMWKRPTEIK